jgi:hypothetical protein
MTWTVVIVGVGKSSLTGQFVSHMWTERYDPTIEDAFRKEININGTECVLEMYVPWLFPFPLLSTFMLHFCRSRFMLQG